MDFLKSLFENGALTWEQFNEGVSKGGFKIADLSSGNYVAKKKYTDDLESRDNTIKELNSQIATRDNDIKALKDQISKFGEGDTKIAELTQQLETLQNNYSQQKADYEEKLSKQAYEHAVRDFAGTKNFTSQAAKRDFINEMINQKLQIKDNTILGAEDFVKTYKENNADAFVVEQKEQDQKPNPSFVNPQQTNPQNPPSDNAFLNAFNFTGVRPHDTK